MVSRTKPNAYSQQWFELFHIPILDTRTIAEVEFVCSFAPLPQFPRVLDVCCGMGRHARALATRGYSVTGVDRDINIVTQARESGGGPIYVQAELREYQPGKESYDAVIVMGQSFGHFEPATNRDVLERLAGALRKGGRMVLDLWNAGFFASHQGERDFYLPDAVIRETKKVEDGRLFVHLTYPNGEEEDFAWELFTPTKMELLIATLPVSLIGCCTDFHTSGEPCVSKPRIQFILERSA